MNTKTKINWTNWIKVSITAGQMKLVPFETFWSLVVTTRPMITTISKTVMRIAMTIIIWRPLGFISTVLAI